MQNIGHKTYNLLFIINTAELFSHKYSNETFISLYYIEYRHQRKWVTQTQYIRSEDKNNDLYTLTATVHYGYM